MVDVILSVKSVLNGVEFIALIFSIRRIRKSRIQPGIGCVKPKKSANCEQVNAKSPRIFVRKN